MEDQKQKLVDTEALPSLEEIERHIEEFALGSYKLEEIKKILSQAKASTINKLFKNGRSILIDIEGLLLGKTVIDDETVKKLRRALHLRFAGGLTPIMLALTFAFYTGSIDHPKAQEAMENLDQTFGAEYYAYL
ncbi:hypothetical protein ACFL21_05325, partial [Patescibacteria group bacterium]